MRQARAESRRDEIVHAAAAEFDEVGYAAASLSSIAARLGRTKGAMSYHFASKASLANEVVVNQYRHWEQLTERIRDDGYAGVDAVVLLSFVVCTRFRDDVLVRAGIRLQLDAGLHDVDLPTPFVRWVAITSALLTDAAAKAEVRLPDGLDAESTAEVLVEAFTGLQQVAYSLTTARDITIRVRNYWRLALPSLGVSDVEHRIESLCAASEHY